MGDSRLEVNSPDRKVSKKDPQNFNYKIEDVGLIDTHQALNLKHHPPRTHGCEK